MRVTVLSTLALAPLAMAMTVQDLWKFPTAPDYTTNITVGSTVQIAWTATLNDVFSIYCTECDIEDVDLWLTSAASGTSTGQLLKAGIDLKTTHSYTWTVHVPAADLKAIDQWNLRFVPSGYEWPGEGGQEVSSSQFALESKSSDSGSGSDSDPTETTTVSYTTKTKTVTKTETETPTPTPTETETTTKTTTHESTATPTASETPSASASATPSSSTTPPAAASPSVPPGGGAPGLRVGAALGAITVISAFFLL